MSLFPQGAPEAGITQMVECHPSKVKVASSSLVSRSRDSVRWKWHIAPGAALSGKTHFAKAHIAQ